VNDFSVTAELDHPLRSHFEALRQFSSTAALEASPLYARLRPEIDRVLKGVAQETLARDDAPARPAIRATAWNIERGRQVDNVIRVLREHPLIRDSDVLLLTELDYGMARSGNRERSPAPWVSTTSLRPAT